MKAGLLKGNFGFGVSLYHIQYSFGYGNDPGSAIFPVQEYRAGNVLLPAEVKDYERQYDNLYSDFGKAKLEAFYATSTFRVRGSFAYQNSEAWFRRYWIGIAEERDRARHDAIQCIHE